MKYNIYGIEPVDGFGNVILIKINGVNKLLILFRVKKNMLETMVMSLAWKTL